MKIVNLNNNYSTTRLCYKLLDDGYLDKNGRIKEDLKFKINIPEFRIQNSKIIGKPKDKFETHLFLPECERRKGEGGLRTKGYFKFSYEKKNGDWYISNSSICKKIKNLPITNNQYTNLPLITVITVVLNGERYLEKTIQSVINQTYPNVEYIIIDGGSTNGTLDIIKKYEDKIDYWVSERDKGIYDAMNKGIIASNGQFLYFLGSDDLLYSNNTLENIFFSHTINYDFIYGNVLLRPIRNKIYDGKFNSYKLMLKNICHQSIFYKRKSFQKYGLYNLKYKSWADHEFNLRIFRKVDKFYKNQIIAIFNDNGFSNTHPDKEFIKDQSRLIKKYLGFNLYIIFICRKKIVKAVKFLLKKLGLVSLINEI